MTEALAVHLATILPDPLTWWRSSHQRHLGVVYEGSEPLDRRLLAQHADLDPAQLLLAIQRWMSVGGTPTVSAFCAALGGSAIAELIEPSTDVALATVLLEVYEHDVDNLRPRQRMLMATMERMVWTVTDLRNAYSEVARSGLGQAEDDLSLMLREYERAAV